jgi:hypothetical protein
MAPPVIRFKLIFGADQIQIESFDEPSAHIGGDH